MITWGLWYWPVFLTVGSLFVLVPETIALCTNAANTLSDYCWRELDVTNALRFPAVAADYAWWLSFATWIMFVIVITIHIWFRSV